MQTGSQSKSKKNWQEIVWNGGRHLLGLLAVAQRSKQILLIEMSEVFG